MQVYKGHGCRNSVVSVAFSPDGTILASCARGSFVRLLWCGTGKQEFLEETNTPCHVSFTPDGEELAFCHDSSQRFCNALTLCKLATGEKRSRDVSGSRIVFSPTGRIFAHNRDVLLWDRQTLTPIWDDGPERKTTHGIAFSPDGRVLATGCYCWKVNEKATAFIRLLDVASGREQGRLVGHSSVTWSVAFSPDGKYLAADSGPFIWVWNVRTEQPVTRLKVGRYEFKQVAFTPDGRFLAATGNEGTVRFWDTATWRQHVAFDWDIGPLVSLDIARDGLRAAAGSKRGKIVVWDIDF